jgi:hypothetical protein
VRRAVLETLMLGFVLAASASAFAQTPTGDAGQIREEIEQLRRAFEQLRQEYGDRLSALEQRLKVIDQQAPPVSPDSARGSEPAGILPVYGNVTALSKIFNPDIAVVGNFLGAVGSRRDERPSLDLQEVETALQAVVDPYARADFFFAFGREGLEIEEGYITFPTLPGGLLAKAGKFRSAIGRVNAMHVHGLPWIDRPLVTMNLLGAEEGISASGLSAARLVPNPWMFLEATGEVSSVGAELAYVARARAYHDLTESSNLDVGVSVARAPTLAELIDASTTSRLIGVDGTFRYRPLRRAIYRRFLARTELLWRREKAAGMTAFGAYVSVDHQLARRWFMGARLDYSQRTIQDASDKGASWLLTFWPSEFSQIRGQYRRTSYAEGRTGNDLLLQVLFSIGAHGAHGF